MAGDGLIRRILSKLFVREKHVCPWWLCFTFDNIFRKLVQDPEKILKPYIQEGSTVLDIGCGMGYFTIASARMVGEKGQVIAADIQEQMLLALKRRAKRAGLEKRIVLQLNAQDSLEIDRKADFALAFWMIHEVPDRVRFLQQIKLTLKSGALFLMAEPTIHVNREMYENTIQTAQEVGFILRSSPRIFLSRSALFSTP
jgi:ubiquinone/menaquinone biosynthesis C-methylase UbiE